MGLLCHENSLMMYLAVLSVYECCRHRHNFHSTYHIWQ